MKARKATCLSYLIPAEARDSVRAMTQDHFRRIALGFPGAVERAHMGHPDFRANGRIFATLAPDGYRGMVKLTPPQQKEFIDANRQVLAPASGAWGRQGCTSVRLKGADDDAVGEAMTLAWQNTVAKQPVKRAGKSTRSPRRNTRARRP
jgi:hypothetical protein